MFTIIVIYCIFKNVFINGSWTDTFFPPEFQTFYQMLAQIPLILDVVCKILLIYDAVSPNEWLIKYMTIVMRVRVLQNLQRGTEKESETLRSWWLWT
jgi:hypothetical protein